jgi:hypothetical protein
VCGLESAIQKLYSDSKLIPEMASESKSEINQENENYEISGGKIVRAIAKLWNILPLNKAEIWD